MATYPHSGTDYPRTELLIDGVWTDINSMTGKVRGEGGTAGLTIVRGSAEAQQRVSAQTSTFRITNTNGVISNRNPASAYYGKLARNTQIRHRAGTGDTFLRSVYNDTAGQNEARTADKAVLDITGDLEVRADIWPHTWRPDADSGGSRSMIIASKYQITGDQRSWAFYLNTSGTLTLVWSTAGTSGTRIFATSTASVPATSTRLSVKATLDVNNGAAGNDVKFYTAGSIGGSYTQLGATVTTGGVTSVFSSSADLCIGTGDDNATIFGGFSFGGRFYELRVYNGIGGTLVANPVFTSQTLGGTSFSDGLGTPNTWTLAGEARICSDRIRFHGELASLSHTWDPTHTDVTANVQAAGMLRRLTAAGAPLRSALFRQLDQYSSVVGWWPMEDASGATSIASGLTDGRPAKLTNTNTGVDGNLPGAASNAQFTATTGAINATCDTTVTSTGTLSFVVFLKLSAVNASTKTLIQIYTSGTARRIEVALDTVGWTISFYSKDNTALSSSTTAFSTNSPVGQWIGFNLLLETSGANVNWSARWLLVERGATFLGIGPTAYAGSVGKVTQVRLTSRDIADYADAQFAHLFLANTDIGFVSSAVSDASSAYLGERAAARIDRLCSEEGLAVEITGMWDSTATMGAQTVSTLAELLFSCADADLGILGESRNTLALTYRTRGDLDARRDIELSYTSSVLSDVPIVPEDDLNVTNDVTASRPSGSSARFIVTSGEMSVQAPPDGIGTYARTFTANVDTDDQLKDVAGWLAHVGSSPDPRIPNVQVALHASEIADGSALAGQVMALECGDTIALTDMPVPLPPDDVLLLLQGYTETLSKYLWTITCNTTPGGVHRTGLYDMGTVNGFGRWDTAGSTLRTSITTTGTTIVLDCTNTSDTWTTDSAQYPFDIVMEGEVITLNNAPGSTSPQTFTGCTRSVNGVVKAHSAGVAASLAEPIYYAIGQ